MTRLKPSERLLRKIREAFPELDIPEGAWLGRAAGAYHGWNRSSLGAWVWTVYCADGAPLVRDSADRPLAIGSQFTMTELLKVPLAANPCGSNLGDIHIEPADEAQRAQGGGERA